MFGLKLWCRGIGPPSVLFSSSIAKGSGHFPDTLPVGGLMKVSDIPGRRVWGLGRVFQ